MAWTTPRTWVAGETVTAAIMNSHVRDNFNAVGDPWTSYTPSWTASTTNPTIGNGTLTGAYRQAGKLVMFRIRIVFGSTTTRGSGEYRWGFPVTAANQNNPGFNGNVFRSSSFSGFTCVGYATTAFRAVLTSTNAAVGDSSPVVFTTGDEIHIGGTYEAA